MAPVLILPRAVRVSGGLLCGDAGGDLCCYRSNPYTYSADTAPGQPNGNGVNASGGVWHEVTTSGAAVPSSSSGGGGYGY